MLLSWIFFSFSKGAICLGSTALLVSLACACPGLTMPGTSFAPWTPDSNINFTIIGDQEFHDALLVDTVGTVESVVVIVLESGYEPWHPLSSAVLPDSTVDMVSTQLDTLFWLCWGKLSLMSPNGSPRGPAYALYNRGKYFATNALSTQVVSSGWPINAKVLKKCGGRTSGETASYDAHGKFNVRI